MSRPASIVGIIVLDMPEPIRQHLSSEAEQAGVSVNEIANTVLCDAYRVPVYRTGKPYVPLTTNGRMVFRVPAKVRKRLRQQAARDGVTMAGLVKVALAEHYGLPAPNPARKPRQH